jgi:hypothetical protein
VENVTYIGSAISGVLYLILGARLVRLAIREKSTCEWLVGITFLVWALSYICWVGSMILQGQPELQSQLLIASRIATNIGGITFALFPYLAFRRGANWARWLVGAIIACLIVGTVGSVWVGDPEGVFPLSNIWWWPEWLGEISSGIWIGVEGFNHYGTSKARVRLGLCEPIVSHRFLLWGIAGICWTLLDFVVIGQYIDYWATQTWSGPLDIAVGLLEIVALTALWIAYFTPATYLRRMSASTERK